MLYALTLAGFVFLFVTFFHFLYERLTSPADKLRFSARLGMDIYIYVGIGIILAELHSDFSLFIYLAWLGGVTILVLLYLSWRFVKKVVKSVFLRLKGGEKPGKKQEPVNWKYYLKMIVMDFSVGILMAVAFLVWFHKYPFLADPEDASMDFVMRVNQCGKESVCTFPGKNNIPPKIVLLNIDNDTHKNKQWGGGEPLFTPRDRIKQLIESAVQDGARLIVVDVFPSQKTSTYGLKTPDGLDYPENKLHPHDQELKDYLASYEEKHCGSNKCPPIILVRESSRPTTESGYFDIQNLPVSQARQSFLEEAVKPSSHIQWASPIFWTSKFDGSLRRMWLWQPFCEGNKQKFIPSVELLVAGLVSNESLDYEKALKKVNDISVSDIDPEFVGKDCSSEHPSYYEPKPLSKSIVLGENLTIEAGELSGGGINQRIMFTMPWKSSPQREGEEQTSSAITGSPMMARFDSAEKEILTIISAFRYLELHQEPNSMLFLTQIKEALKGSIVIIGNSHFDARDVHQTPLGEMPGMLVIANAIHSLLLNHGQIKSLGWGKIVAETMLIILLIVFIIVGVILMNVVPSILAWYWFVMVVVTGCIWYFFTGYSALFLKQGTWIDFSLPLVTIFFHHVVTKFHELGHKAKEAKTAKTEAKTAGERAEKAEAQWQTCQGELDKCKQDKQQLLLNLEKLSVKK
ncbi:MAG: hypothetical protein BWK78_04990 [Thiotrichaceae bacterium IS1]|nr:MAG: hypothetical protein BWK78_04990 [Thiotrichaceae bacterium IS1]